MTEENDNVVAPVNTPDPVVVGGAAVAESLAPTAVTPAVAADVTVPAKRGKGRPKGSKNKVNTVKVVKREATPVKRKRGRPANPDKIMFKALQKERKLLEKQLKQLDKTIAKFAEKSIVKRGCGRPPKNPVEQSVVKRGRGRPKGIANKKTFDKAKRLEDIKASWKRINAEDTPNPIV